MVEKKKTVQKKIQDEQNAFQGFMRTDLTMFDYLLTAWRLLEKLTCQILSYVATTVEARSNGNLVVVVAFGVGSCLTDYKSAALQNGKWGGGCACVHYYTQPTRMRRPGPAARRMRNILVSHPTI